MIERKLKKHSRGIKRKLVNVYKAKEEKKYIIYELVPKVDSKIILYNKEAYDQID